MRVSPHTAQAFLKAPLSGTRLKIGSQGMNLFVASRMKKNGNFWAKVTAEKSIEFQENIQRLMNQQRKMDKRQNDLRKCLAAAYEDKVKGVMDDETFVLLSGQFKKERDQLKEAQQKIQAKFETAQTFQDGLTRFKKEVEGQDEIRFLTRDIVGQFVDWIAVYVGTSPSSSRSFSSASSMA